MFNKLKEVRDQVASVLKDNDVMIGLGVQSGATTIILYDLPSNEHMTYSGIPLGNTFSFSQALQLLKWGFRVARKGWNGKNMFLIHISPYHNDQYSVIEHSEISGTLAPYIAMKTADNMLVPWLASQTDLLVEDWVLVIDDSEVHTDGSLPVQ